MRARAPFGVSLAWSALGVTGIGCRQVLGLDDYRVARSRDASVQDSAPKFVQYEGIAFEKDCGTCLEQSCRVALQACTDDPACDGYVKCDALCDPGNIGCASGCMGIWGPTLRSHESWDLLTCRATRCADSCGLPCDGVCLGNITCDGCLEKTCSAEGKTLACNANAMATLACEAATSALGLGIERPSCLSGRDAGVDDFKAWDTCRTARCPECGVFNTTPDWSCVGQIKKVQPPSTLTGIRFTALVEDFGGASVTGVTVSPCTFPGPTCGAPVPTNGAPARLSATGNPGQRHGLATSGSTTQA